jgi:hypothetical protein
MNPTPSYLHVNTAEEVEQAALGKWDGVVINLTSTSNPNKHDWTVFTAQLNAAAQHGMLVLLRLGAAGAAAKNSDGTPSWWATNYNNGKTWPTPNRLPITVARMYAQIYLKKAIEIAVNIFSARNLVANLTLAIGNEAGVGGANCVCLGRWSVLGQIYNSQFKPAWAHYLTTHSQSDYLKAKNYFLEVFPMDMWLESGPIPEGTVEPYYWSMIRAEIEQLGDASGLPIFPYSFEGAKGTVGQREIDSYKGIDAQWIADRCGNRAGTNRYMNTPCDTPGKCGIAYVTDLGAQIGRMRKNPRLTGPIFNIEFGMHMKTKDTDLQLIIGHYDIAEGRQAVLTAQRAMNLIVGGGFYRARADDGLSIGFNLANADGSAVGKFLVCPAHG